MKWISVILYHLKHVRNLEQVTGLSFLNHTTERLSNSTSAIGIGDPTLGLKLISPPLYFALGSFWSSSSSDRLIALSNIFLNHVMAQMQHGFHKKKKQYHVASKLARSFDEF